MIALTSDQYLSPEEYLELEKISEVRHEYIDEKRFAMAGSNNAHNKINGNFLITLSLHLRGSSCQTYTNDMKVKVRDGKRFYYPDLLISCDPENQDLTAYAMGFPTLIIEILSDSTEAFDRGNKFKDYRSIPSLKEYILVSSHQYSVDCFRRGENDFWILQSDQGLDSNLRIESLNLDVSMQDIYATIDFPPEVEDVIN
ncbi:MAG: Uma2 family endonuclease [Limnothrix sp. RL_2_0]|nr:Uma2 family endonuclease [Limnothrix sp. RL_2_0]